MNKILIIRTYPTIMNINTYNSQELGLAKAFIDKGYECDIVYYNGKKPTYIQKIDYKEKEINIYWLKAFKILNNGIFPKLKKIASKYDFYQVSEYDQITSRFFYKKYPQRTYVYQGVYNSNISWKHNLKDFFFNHLFLSKKIKKNTKIITKSDLAKDDMLKLGFSNVYTVGVGMDFSRFNVFEHSIEKEKTLLYIGRIEDRRNILFLIEVMNYVLKKYNDYKLKIYGSGDENYLKLVRKKIADLGLEDNVIINGMLPQNELAKIYKKSTLFLLPTKYEIFGMVLLESMYFGLPVITSNNGGASTLMQSKKYGLIIDDFDVEKWGEGIIELLSNHELYEEISFNARKNVVDNYSWEIIAEKILSIIRKE